MRLWFSLEKPHLYFDLCPGSLPNSVPEFYLALKFLNLLRDITSVCRGHTFNLDFPQVSFNGLCLSRLSQVVS